MPRMPKPEGPSGTVWFGGEVERVEICFRVFAEALDPGEITRILGILPTRSRRKGDAIIGRSGATGRTAKTGSWIYDFKPTPEMTVDESIAGVLAEFPDDEAIWERLTDRCDVDLICDVFVRGANQGFEVSPEVLLLLGRRRIKLGVDIFTEPDEKQAAELAERLS
jgi:hypothetical protein